MVKRLSICFSVLGMLVGALSWAAPQPTRGTQSDAVVTAINGERFILLHERMQYVIRSSKALIEAAQALEKRCKTYEGELVGERAERIGEGWADAYQMCRF